MKNNLMSPKKLSVIIILIGAWIFFIALLFLKGDGIFAWPDSEAAPEVESIAEVEFADSTSFDLVEKGDGIYSLVIESEEVLTGIELIFAYDQTELDIVLENGNTFEQYILSSQNDEATPPGYLIASGVMPKVTPEGEEVVFISMTILRKGDSEAVLEIVESSPFEDRHSKILLSDGSEKAIRSSELAIQQ